MSVCEFEVAKSFAYCRYSFQISAKMPGVSQLVKVILLRVSRCVSVEETWGGIQGLALQEKTKMKGMCGWVGVLFFFLLLPCLIARESRKCVRLCFALKVFPRLCLSERHSTSSRHFVL